MDISTVKPVSDWIEFELETKELVKIKFKIEYIPQASVIDYINREGKLKIRGSDIAFDMVLDHVRDWDLKLGDKVLDPTEENKLKYRQELRYIFDILIKPSSKEEEAVVEEKEDESVGQTVSSALYAFARNQDNFLKN